MRARSDTGLMIIKLRKYNSAAELLIGSQGAGLPGQGYNWSVKRGVSVTRAAVRMKGMDDSTRGRDGNAYNPPPIRERGRMQIHRSWSLERAINNVYETR